MIVYLRSDERLHQHSLSYFGGVNASVHIMSCHKTANVTPVLYLSCFDQIRSESEKENAYLKCSHSRANKLGGRISFFVANGGIPLFFSSVLMKFKMSVSSWLHTTLLFFFFFNPPSFSYVPEITRKIVETFFAPGPLEVERGGSSGTHSFPFPFCLL